MQEEENSPKELKALQWAVPFAPFATSCGLGWEALQAVRYRKSLASVEFALPPMSSHALVLTIRPPEKLNLRYEGVKRDSPLPAGSIVVVPAGCSVLWRRRGRLDALFIYLEPSLVARVATESFEFDSTRTVVPPFFALSAPALRSVMSAVYEELRGGDGVQLLVESLATILSVHLIRHIVGPHRLPPSADGVLPRPKLHTVIEYIMENLEGRPTLEQMAAVAHLNPYHFARRFKASTGLAPHQYLISRRIERAQHLLRAHDELSLAEAALRVGFSDQSKFSFHFKRIVGVTPRQFRISARIT
jgi:AraC family transcriptional regulator